MKFGIQGQLTDVITCVKFLVDGFRGYGVLTPPKLPFPIDLLRRIYSSVALPCDTVMMNMPTKYEVSMLNHSIDIEGVPKSPYLLTKFALRNAHVRYHVIHK